MNLSESNLQPYIFRRHFGANYLIPSNLIDEFDMVVARVEDDCDDYDAATDLDNQFSRYTFDGNLDRLTLWIDPNTI